MCTTETPRSKFPAWTFLGWIWGLVGFLFATFYMLIWYFIFAIPLLVVFAIIAIFVSHFGGINNDPMGLATLILSPISITFLLWQFFAFIGPAYFDILRAVGFFLQRAHHLTPAKSIEIVKRRRTHVTKQLGKMISWLRHS